MTATTINPKQLPITGKGSDMHPAERWMYKELTDGDFWRNYRTNKADYARFTAKEVAELARISNTEFLHLIYRFGLGIDVIGMDQVKAYYEEHRPGYTVDVVATQE